MTHLPFRKTGLTPEVQKKAKLELGETSEIREKTLKEFRQLIAEHHDIITRLDDVFLLRFLRCRKYDVQKALKVLRNYHRFYTDYGGEYCGRTPVELKRFLEMKCCSVGPDRIPPGSHLSFVRLGQFDMQKTTAKELMSLWWIQGEICLEYELGQVCGGIYIADFKDTTYAHYAQFLSISLWKMAIQMLQDCWPERFKCIHFVNEPLLLHAVINCIRVFMTKKLKDRFHFHGIDMNSLHAEVPKQYLPKELGGTAGTYDDMDYVDFFVKEESYFESNKKYGIVKNPSEQ